MDANFGQPFGHFHGPQVAPAAGAAQAGDQVGVVRVKAQADDMHRFANEGDGYFSAGQVAHAACLGSGSGAVLPADLVMVGQRP